MEAKTVKTIVKPIMLNFLFVKIIVSFGESELVC